ncbi:MAG: hypothetical protein JNL21_14060 [Myxococcales bacterium]|nr:hypothetical protein [Myxococcales bacterium]
MSDGSGAPTSNNTSSAGNKTCCPAQVNKICHVKSLKVTVHPKRRDGAPDAKNPMVKGQMAAAAEGQKSLEATLTNNRIAAPAEDLVKKEQFQKEVSQGLGAARQATRDAYDQSRQAAQQVYQTRSVKGVQGPTGPTADQRTAMGKAPGAQMQLAKAWLQKAWDRECFELLQRYDLVIETVAGFYPDTDAAWKAGNPRTVSTVDIRVEAQAEGTCPVNTHLYLSAQANKNTGVQFIRSSPPPIGFGATDYKLSPAAWKKGVAKFELVDIMAATIGQDTKTASNPLVAIIKVLFMGLEVLKPLDVEFALHTCGKKGVADLHPAQLNALVRIYRETSFAIGVKIPPFRKFERSSVRTAPGGTLLSEAEAVTSRKFLEIKKANVDKKTTSHFASPGTTTGSEEAAFSIYFKLNDIEINLSELYDKVKDPSKRSELVYDEKDQKQVDAVVHAGKWTGSTAGSMGRAAGSGLVLTKDAMKVGIGLGDLQSWSGVALGAQAGVDMFRLGLLRTFQSIYAAWKAADFIKNLLAVMERFPQCGFKIAVEWSFLEGSFEASIANAQGGNFKAKSPILQAAEQRFIPISWKGKVSAGFTIIAGKLEASFGILIDFSVVGRAEARVVGQISGLIEAKGLEAEFQRGEDTKCKASIGGKLSGRLFAVAAVESWVYSTKKEIGIEAGIAGEGYIEAKFKENAPMEVEKNVKLWTLPVQWYFIAENSRTGARDGKVHVLFEQRPIWELK